MTKLLLALCMLWHSACALTMTTTMTSTTVTPVPMSTNATTVGTTEAAQSTPATTTTKPTHTELLRQDLSALHLSHRQRGRVILATTHVEGSDDWGVSAAQAELSCDRIARLQHNRIGRNEGFLFPFRNRWNREKPKMDGHLLSIGSSYEVITLSRLLHPLPDGSFWTGGKLTRYRVNTMKTPSPTDHIVLTWTDGKLGRPQVLGMTREDELQLQEGYTYCLALNLRESAWQARDCSDQLPYACLVTPRQVSFSNKAQVSAEIQYSTTTPANDATTSSVSSTTEGTAAAAAETTTPSNESSEASTNTPEATNGGTVLSEVNTTPNVDEVQSTVATPLPSQKSISPSAGELKANTVTPAPESTISTTPGTPQSVTPVLLQATELTTSQTTPSASTVSISEDDESEENDETAGTQ